MRKTLAVCALLLVAVGCQNDDPTPTAPSLHITNTAIATNNNGGATASPGPGTGTGCMVSRLAGGIFGDSGGGSCAGRIAGQIKVGCTVNATVTPKRADNTDASPVEHGNALSFSVERNAGAVSKLEDSSNPFNYSMRAVSVGDGSGYAIKATLVVPGCPTPFEHTYEFPIQP